MGWLLKSVLPLAAVNCIKNQIDASRGMIRVSRILIRLAVTKLNNFIILQVGFLGRGIRCITMVVRVCFPLTQTFPTIIHLCMQSTARTSCTLQYQCQQAWHSNVREFFCCSVVCLNRALNLQIQGRCRRRHRVLLRPSCISAHVKIHVRRWVFAWARSQWPGASRAQREIVRAALRA